MKKIDEDIIKAHSHCNYNRVEIERSETCGCFYCLRVYTPDKVDEWLGEISRDKNEQTALCPFCDIDSVVGSASGFPITPVFLQRMKAYWFGLKPTLQAIQAGSRGNHVTSRRNTRRRLTGKRIGRYVN